MTDQLANVLNVLRFDEIGIGDIPRVGGKNASLGEMFCELSREGVKVPDGFAITAEAYRRFLRENRLDHEIPKLLAGLNTSDIDNLRDRGKHIRQAMLQAEFSSALQDSILKAYERLSEPFGRPLDVAVRSSATAEDLPDASFAGQQETYLNVHGPRLLLESCKRCFASLFTDRAISYRVAARRPSFMDGTDRDIRRSLSNCVPNRVPRRPKMFVTPTSFDF